MLGLKPALDQLLTGYSYLTTLFLGFLTGKMGLILGRKIRNSFVEEDITTLQGCFEN